MLVLAPTPTYPLDAGNRKRIHHVCETLTSNGAKLTFLHYPAESEWRDRLPLESHRMMSAQWEATFVAPVTRPLHASAIAGDHAIDEWWDPAIGDILAWLFRVRRFDTFIVNYAWLSKAFEFCPPNILKILDTHDRLSGRREMLASYGIEPEFFHLTEAEESVALNRADVIWSIKPQEAEFFRTLASRPVINLPFVEPIHEPVHRTQSWPTMRFGIVGAANNVNRVNIEKFLDAAELYIQKTLLPCEFWIAGSCCELLRNRNLPYIRHFGRIKDIYEFYRVVDVVLAPITFSTGLKIKVGEALGAGKALLSHEHAFEGYHVTHDFHKLPTLDAMLRACRSVVADPLLVEQLENCSRASMAASIREFDAATATTLDSYWRIKSAVCILVSSADVFTGSIIIDHVVECATYLGHVAPILIVVDGDSEWRADILAVQRLARVGRLLTTDDAQPAPEPDHTDTTNIAYRAIGDVIGDGHLVYWFASRPRLPRTAQHCRARAYVAVDALSCSQARTGFDELMSDLEQIFYDIVLVRRRHMCLYRADVDGVVVRTYFASLLWRGASSETVRTLKLCLRRSVAMMADEASDPLVALCVSVALRTTHDPIDIIVDQRPGAEVDDCAWREAAEAGRVSIIFLPDYVRADVLAAKGPRIAFDLSSSPSFDGLREILANARVPNAELFASGARPVSGNWVSQTSRAGVFESLAWLQTLLREPTAADALLAARDEAANYRADPGWGRVWSDLVDLKARSVALAPATN